MDGLPWCSVLGVKMHTCCSVPSWPPACPAPKSSGNGQLSPFSAASLASAGALSLPYPNQSLSLRYMQSLWKAKNLCMFRERGWQTPPAHTHTVPDTRWGFGNAMPPAITACSERLYFTGQFTKSSKQSYELLLPLCPFLDEHTEVWRDKLSCSRSNSTTVSIQTQAV